MLGLKRLATNALLVSHKHSYARTMAAYDIRDREYFYICLNILHHTAVIYAYDPFLFRLLLAFVVGHSFEAEKKEEKNEENEFRCCGCRSTR